MTLKELQNKMPEGYVMVDANLRGRKNHHGYNHVYVAESGRIYLTFGLAWYARYPKEEFHNYVRNALNAEIHFFKDITDNYKTHNIQKIKKLKLILK